MFVGIGAGLVTCALWGLTFVAPRTIAPFTTWDLTAARYGLFGVASLVLMLHPRFRPVRMSRSQAVTGVLLGALAAPGYFVCAAGAVRLAGATVPPLVIGLAPALLTLVASRQETIVPWRLVAWPVGLILVGLAIVNLDVFRGLGPAHGTAPVAGLALSLVALAMWVAFGFINAAVMRARDPPDGLHWTGLQGIGAGLGAALLLPTTNPGTLVTAPASALGIFAFWAVLMGIVGSWVATWCWVVASRRLPLALLSQLIVAETVFGLLYGFLYERRWPNGLEWVGSALQLAGVASAIALFSRAPRPDGMEVAHVIEETALP